jgi:cell division protein FtsI (penicillin-binding protein 3)
MVVRKVLDQRTLAILNDVFREVVQIGTAKKALDEQCSIAGKTGTALRRKNGSREYASGKALASFVGYFPADAPRIVGIVMYDEPGFSIYGGDVSAPVFKNIAKRYGGLPGNNLMVNSRLTPHDRSMNAAARAGENATIIPLTAERIVVTASSKRQSVAPEGFPDFTGQTIRDAIRAVKNRGFECRISGAGMVKEQSPPAGIDTTGVQTVELIGETR